TFYISAAVLLLNTLAAVVVANLFLGFIFWVRDAVQPNPTAARKTAPAQPGVHFNPDGSPVDNGKRSLYQLDWIDFNAYGDVDAAYVSEVLDDFFALSNLGLQYQPWVQFAEPTFHGKHLIIENDVLGFPRRRTVNRENSAKRPIVEIFTLGGSTTFGYNVSDEHTWPSYLSEVLNDVARRDALDVYVHLTNYGRAYYYPSQETALLIDLLKTGHRPNLVIFLDGVNWSQFRDVPFFYEEAKRQFFRLQFAERPADDQSLIRRFEWIPFVRLATALNRRLSGTAPSDPAAQWEARENPGRIDRLVNLFRQNRAISAKVCEVYSIRCLFVLQPHPVATYPVELYRRSLPEDFYPWRDRARAFYDRMRADPDYLYLGDLFSVWGKRKAVIDELHYSPAFNRFLAEQIARHIDLKRLVPRTSVIDTTAATGMSRTD
ncbi:MAG TPA: hypothetical protein VHF07_06515, partial [Nitrospiraceae bacterium]|nr:hypothetical protein [Nitrospiraceae bacterium]